MVDVLANLDRVTGRIRQAAARAKRSAEDVHLVVVSKQVSVDLMQEALAGGVRAFGESRVQEMLSKISQFPQPGCRWHFIGHLQRNKVRHLAGLCELIHSVDQLKLAADLDAQCGRAGICQKVLIQVNVSGERQKHGIAPGEAGAFIRAISRHRNLSVQGLMTIPPQGERPEQSRPIYRELRRMARAIHREDIDGVTMRELSMGMSNDFEVAVEEGATLVRVGTEIFGHRREE